MNMCSNEYVLTMTTTNNNDRRKLTSNSYTIIDITTNFQQESTTIQESYADFKYVSLGCGCDKNVTLGFEWMIDREGPKNLFRI